MIREERWRYTRLCSPLKQDGGARVSIQLPPMLRLTGVKYNSLCRTASKEGLY